MNQRERVLAGCMAAVLVGYGGFTLIKSQVVDPREGLTEDIKTQSERRDHLQILLNGADKIVGDWQKQTGQTLGLEAGAAQDAFREDVNTLLQRHKLTQDLVITPYKARVERKGYRENFTELPISVRTKGKLADVVSFMKDLYQRPYVVRVDKLSLVAEHGRKSSRKKKAGRPPEPTLSVSMTLSTLVLPPIDEIEHPTLDLAAYNDPAREVEPVAVASRLAFEDMEEYGEIAEKNFFWIYEPPPPVVKKTPKPEPNEEPKVKPTPTTTPKVVVDVRKDADKWVLCGMGWVDAGPIAYVTNIDDAGMPPEEYYLNDEIDDGRLVLIVPEGMVVRVAGEKQGTRTLPPKNYFYPLGETFKDRVEVQPAKHPQIAQLLQQVLKQ